MELIYKILWSIIGGGISILFVGGIIGALCYIVYYYIKYGKEAFEKEFMAR